MSVTVESVKALLDSEDFGDRLRGVNQLRELEPSVAFEMILPVVVDANVRVRYAAVSQMSSLGDQDLARSLEVLRDRLLNDPETDVKAAAADALGGLKLTDAFEDLRDQYHQSQEWLLRFSIIAALGEMGDPRGMDLLTEALSADNELVRTAAIGAIGELQDPQAMTLLAPFASDEDWQVRYRVVQAMRPFRDQPEAQAILQRLTGDAMDPVATEAQNLLGAD